MTGDRGAGEAGSTVAQVALALLLSGMLAGCDRSVAGHAPDAGSEAALTVSVATARRRDVPRMVSATGTVMPWQELTLGAESTALSIVEVRVKENDAVRAGDLLVRLDGRSLKAQIAQQKAAIAEAQANVEVARQEAARGDALVLQKAMSQEAVETRRSAIRTSQAKLDQAVASLDNLQTSLDQTFVRAPVDGIVSTDPVKLGTVPQAGTELLRIERDGRLEVQAKVPERQLTLLKPDQVAAVTGPGGLVVEGRVRDVAAKIDATTRLGIVYVSLPARSPLKAGMFASLAVTVGAGQAVEIPEQAMVWPNGRSSVFVVAQDDTVRLARLTTGPRNDGRVTVEAGLADGDRVVTLGAGFLHDGDRVRIEPALASADQAEPAP